MRSDLQIKLQYINNDFQKDLIGTQTSTIATQEAGLFVPSDQKDPTEWITESIQRYVMPSRIEWNNYANQEFSLSQGNFF